MSRHPLRQLPNLFSRITPLLFVALVCSPAFAQQSILANFKTAADAEQYRSQIKAVVNNRLAKVKSDDPAESRKWFADQVSPNQNPSPSFLDVYADVVNNAIHNALHAPSTTTAPSTPLPLAVRLNLAIVNETVAARVGNARQAQVTDEFLKDPSGAIVLWGMKAAKYELAPSLAQPKVMRKVDLLTSILNAVRAHPASGPIADEAYQALTFEAADGALRATGNSAIQEATAAMLQVVSFRVSLFGDSAPPELFADGRAVVFLTRTKVWDLDTPAQQAEVMHDFVKFLDACGKLIPNADSDDHLALLELTHQIGRAMYTISQDKSSPELKTASDRIGGIASDSKPEDIEARLQAVHDIVDKIYPK